MFQGSKEVWSHRETQHVDKEHQTKGFRKIQDLLINLQTQMSGKDADEENEGYT